MTDEEIDPEKRTPVDRRGEIDPVAALAPARHLENVSSQDFQTPLGLVSPLYLLRCSPEECWVVQPTIL